ncbi:feruloyl esterase B precursor [Aspergillus nomiae NRRL 13137]|uniref:Carboxylic ester hydrolase n=1 Tax=Aspergillus nomiae NRRL (strain ATCC 15546 / NRRL 13137 / CBS 260.88 / M93) TaxID=1509407 RepID=A0A0L1JDI8_ASPN3|nr:feruloyl esterase B precursor [Aspergillus nomiae NRRL 13137]KNG89854.1 feruloyl esterase B precursor [Aspergillus nomiae NRRL 13137]
MFLPAAPLLCLSAVFFQAASASECSPGYFPKPELPGAAILDIQAHEAHNFSTVSLGPGTNDGGRYTISFCNVTVLHTHPGWNDTITTQVWLPLKGWNGRFQGLGGGGYSTGFGSTYLTYAVAQGFAASSTDGGHATGSGAIPTDLEWALSSKGNVNWFLLENYASKATNDMAVIGKQITKSYYQRAANYSYFTGCSGGGRQGLAMAQNYPDAFDGILAVAPALNMETFIPAAYWPTQVMHNLGTYPSPCEIEAFVSAAVKACDLLDGVQDGIISSPGLCNVTAHSFIGEEYICRGKTHKLTASGAAAVQAAWSGSGNDGWFGVNKDAVLTTLYIPTACAANGTCYSSGADLSGNWFRYLVAKDPEFALNNMTESAFFESLHASAFQYAPMLANTNPDLSKFKANGGKVIAWHGLADEAIPPRGSTKYFEEVLKTDPSAHDFYRLFEAPGVGHCYGGLGPVPNGALFQLMDWVEKDLAPATLQATKGNNGTARDLCPYPLQQRFIGGDARNASSFTCVKMT